MIIILIHLQQERFCGITPPFLRKAKAMLFCFDLSNRSTFVDLIEKWLPQIAEKKDQMLEYAVFYMVGLKSELKDPLDNFSAEAEVN
jgi:GTPase SAR1 family protein